MVGLLRLRLVGITLLAAALMAGCLDATGSDQGTGDGEGPRDDADDPSLLGPYAHFVAGVDAMGPGFLADGGALGVVWDLGDGEPLAGVQLIAQCVVFELQLPLGGLVAVSDALGRFEFPPSALLAGCDEVVYDALKPGYELESPLRSGPLDDDSQYFVKLGLQRA